MTYKRKPSSAISDGKGKQHSVAPTRSTLASLAMEEDDDSDSEEVFEPLTNPNLKQRVINIHPTKFSPDILPANTSAKQPQPSRSHTPGHMSILGMLRTRKLTSQAAKESAPVDEPLRPQSKLTSSMEEEDCTQKTIFPLADPCTLGSLGPLEM